MSIISAGLFIALDGVVEDPGEWNLPYFNDEMGAAVSAQLGAADTVLLGRRTYDSFAGAWPDREADGGEDAAFAKKLGDTRKVVVTGQDRDLGWRNVERLSGDLVPGVTALKSEEGVDHIGISGSISVVRQLLAVGLVDELHLLVHPIAVRRGMRLFDDGPPITLRLLSATAFTTGVVHQVYGPDVSASPGSSDDVEQHLSQSDA
jgi:dihydrofolate reductase